MQTFDQHLMALFKGGKITLKDAKDAASNPADFERNLTFE
jgi:Tfp pilus assembly ATPase PilU